jgi:hypothetical protein
MELLSEWQRKALEWLSRPANGRTCTIVGAMLTQRQSSFGHQTSAREGGRTLRSLQRRGFVTYRDVDGGLHRNWSLTPAGLALITALEAEKKKAEKPQLVCRARSGDIMTCVCGHSEEEHGHDPEYPGSTSCSGVVDGGNDKDEPCGCLVFEIGA